MRNLKRLAIYSITIAIVVLSAACGKPGTNGETASADTESGEIKQTPENAGILNEDSVIIEDRDSYFYVTLDFTKEASHKNIGKKYAEQILKAVPDYEAKLDSFLEEQIGTGEIPEQLLQGINIIKGDLQNKGNLRKEYMDELDGLASGFSGTENFLGDGKLSKDEVYILNLSQDIVRNTFCSALSVYGKRSETNSTITGRVIDIYGGKENQLDSIQAVITYKNKDKSIFCVGYLGFMGVITGLNDDGVLAFILSSNLKPADYGTAAIPDSSYAFDLRHALEISHKLDEVVNYMYAADRTYMIGHLIFVSDENTSKVVENNVRNSQNIIREVRTEKSELNSGIEWNIDDSIAAVNSFVLKGNYDNHTTKDFNYNRWDNFRDLMVNSGDTVSIDEMKKFVSFYSGDEPAGMDGGDINSYMTQKIMVIEPKELKIEIAFREKDGSPMTNPEFEEIKIDFD